MGGGLKGHPGGADPNSKQQVTDRASLWAGDPSSAHHRRKGMSLAILTLLFLCLVFLLFSSRRE